MDPKKRAASSAAKEPGGRGPIQRARWHIIYLRRVHSVLFRRLARPGGYLNGRHPSQGNMPDSFDGDFDGYEATLRRPRALTTKTGRPFGGRVLTAHTHELFDRLSQHVVGQEARQARFRLPYTTTTSVSSLGAESNDDDVELANGRGATSCFYGPHGFGQNAACANARAHPRGAVCHRRRHRAH